MKRALLVTVASLCLAVIPSVVAISDAEAVVAQKAAVCPSFKKAGTTIEWSVIGSGWTCGSAKKWVSKLIGESVTKSDPKVTFTDGPKGFHCTGVADATGHATLGDCYKGTLAHPTSGFQWFG
jgi:hypothetical protein